MVASLSYNDGEYVYIVMGGRESLGVGGGG